ncbi:MAG: efflux RND transporter periplasmic adaptor subunit [Enhydrobacter sp.]|nr:efflux RND transporter periplasmic adaptor subunit [Enhydrobacter sp.]
MLIMLVLVGALAGGLYWFQNFKTTMIAKALSDYAAAPQTVSAVEAGYQQWQPQLRVIGTLRASQGVDVSPSVPGVVEEISFESGQDVEAGALLVSLALNDATSRLKQLEAAAELANTNYQRNLRQLREKIVSQASVDSDASSVKSAQADVEAQQALIAQKSVRAPFAGRLGIRQVDKGQYLNPGVAIVSLQAIDPMFVDFLLPQQALGQIAVDQPVMVKVDAFSDQTFAGKIVAINVRVDTTTRNVQVRASLSNPGRKLLPGMYATVEITTGAPKRLLTLPVTAITYNAYGNTVFVVEDAGKDDKGKPVKRVKQTFVKTGETRGDQVAVLDGIEEKQTIVTAGQLKLTNDTAVVIDNTVQPDSRAVPILPPR